MCKKLWLLNVEVPVWRLWLLDVGHPASIHFVDPAKLVYIEYDNRALVQQYEAGEDDTRPALIPDGFVQVGPT